MMPFIANSPQLRRGTPSSRLSSASMRRWAGRSSGCASSRGPGATPADHVWLPTHREVMVAANRISALGVPPLKVGPPRLPCVELRVCIPRRRECHPHYTSRGAAARRVINRRLSWRNRREECDRQLFPEKVEAGLRRQLHAANPKTIVRCRPDGAVQLQRRARPCVRTKSEAARLRHHRHDEARNGDQHPVIARLPQEGDNGVTERVCAARAFAGSTPA